jgi:hypothetical protein
MAIGVSVFRETALGGEKVPAGLFFGRLVLAGKQAERHF